MKTPVQIFLFFLTSTLAIGQSTHNFSMGASYANGEYYNLATDATTSVAHNTWDIAFSVYGATDAGIFINEGAAFMGTPPKLYLVPNKNFSDNITASDLGDQLKNPEKTWGTGAFNTVKVASNWADYGWGIYNPSNHKVEGNRLYVVELGNGSQKKLMVDSLKGGTYYFSYADLDGSNLQHQTIAKSNFANQTLAYFSFANNATISGEPTTGWDWLFTRYETVLDNNGTPMPYNVGGILTNKNVEAVKASGIDPATVDAANYTTSADSLTIIGHTWKSYGFGAGWSVDANRVYFVKTADSTLYKIQFIDFQGSSTGTGTFLKTLLGQWTGVETVERQSVLEQFQVFPNPATTQLNLTFSLEQAQENMHLQLTNMLGQVVFETTVEGRSGLNGIELNVSSFDTGNYILTLQSDRVLMSKPVILK